jgi:hypothetical protein
MTTEPFVLTLIGKDDPVKASYVIKNNNLLFEWYIEKKNNLVNSILKESNLVIYYTLGQLNYSKDGKDIVFYGFFSNLFIDADYFKKITKDFFNKYVFDIEKIKNKYIKPYNSISRKHEKLINQKEIYIRMIKLYTSGNLMNMKKETLKKDEDKFFSNFSSEPRNIGTKNLNNKIIKMIKEFPRTNKEVIVWRAIRLDKPSKKGDIIKQDIVFSTSLNPYVSLDFMDSCCLYKITLPPKYPVLFINKYLPWEEEVMIVPSTIKVDKVHKIKKKDISKFLKDPVFPHVKRFAYQVNRTNKDVDIFECSIDLL